jgi:hypothetical protein
VSEARSINRAKILTARTDTAAEVAEVAAAEASAAEAAAAVKAVAAAEAAAAAGAAAKAAADALGARTALAPELPKEPGGGAEAAAAAGAAAKAAADALGARTALAPELPKEPGGGADGMAEDVEEIPGRPMFSVGAREELKTRGGSLSSEGENSAVQAERSKLIKFLRSLQFTYAPILNLINKLYLSSEFIFMVNAIPA